MNRISISFVFLFLLGVIACESIEPVSYDTDIKDLLGTCGNLYCHGPGNEIGNTISYESTVEFASNPKFLPAIKHEANFSPMPKGGDKLSNEAIELIERWIQEGMAE